MTYEVECPTCKSKRTISKPIPRNCYSCASKLASTPEKRAKHSAAARRTMNGFKKGHIPFPFDAEKHRMAVSKGAKNRYAIPENRLKASEQGKRLVVEGKCLFWKGGISTENELVRHSIEYKLWRESVFKRDDYTCQSCRIRGGTLNADHIKPFSLFPELRTAIDNGRTLCVPCHKKTATYGRNISRISPPAVLPMGGQ